MKDNFTINVSDDQYAMEELKKEQTLVPSEKTLMFLKLFARNYTVEKSLPEGLQEIILG